jgi:hypothetical protein
MKLPIPLLALLLAMPLHAQTPSMAEQIREGRAALSANNPAEARRRFAAALAHSDGRPGDVFAAAVGLGRSALWLGDYSAAAAAFRTALNRAGSDSEKQTAATGLAQALNAQDYPHKAFALVAPYTHGDPRSTLELMRASQSLGWQDKSKPYLQATTAPKAGSYLGNQYRLLEDDMDYALAPRLQGDFAYSHDSEDLDTYRIDGSFLSAPIGNGGLIQRWGGSTGATWVDDQLRTRRLNDASLLAQLRISDIHTVDVSMGAGQTGSWQYLQGAADWTVQSNDSFSFSAAAERAPILTDTAIERRLVYTTYSLGSTLRPATHWYVTPTYYRQVFSDGNHRDGGSLRLQLSPYDIPGTSGAIGAMASSRIYHSSEPSRGVYFNPTNYRATEFGLIGVYSLSPRWKLHATASTGRQVIDGNGAGIYTLDVSVQGRLPHNGRLALHLGRSSAASVNGGGGSYWNDTIGLSLSYPL